MQAAQQFKYILVIYHDPDSTNHTNPDSNNLNTGSFKKIWTSSTLATEVTGPDTVIFSYGDTLKTMPTNHKLQDRIRAAVQTTEGEQVS